MASNQQMKPPARPAGPGRPKVAPIKPGAKTTAPADGKKPKGSKKLIFLVLIVLVLAGGGYFAYQRLHPGSKSAKPVAATSGPQATYSLTALTVNLADVNSSHFLRIQVVLQYPQSEAALATELKAQEYIIDDRVISDLRTKTFSDLSTDQGEAALKVELMHTINSVLTKGQVDAVYFDDFLIQ